MAFFLELKKKLPPEVHKVFLIYFTLISRFIGSREEFHHPHYINKSK